MRSMVEGQVEVIRNLTVFESRGCPSTPDCVGGPPPRSGEDHESLHSRSMCLAIWSWRICVVPS
jgi:hypothetical protein